MTNAHVAAQPHFPPYVHIDGIRNPKLEGVPALAQFQEMADSERVIRSYAIRVRRPKFPWIALAIGVILVPAVIAGVAADGVAGTSNLGFTELAIVVAILAGFFWYLFVRPRRGHTYLYLTDRRIVIVELVEGVSGRNQTILNYNLKDIAGFQVYTQHGIWRLLNLLKIREKRTFYIGLLTSSSASFTLGALGSQHSDYDPGRDAVTLCADLDSTLLAIKAGMAASMEVA